jgi:predicted nucleic acid-binding protein
MIYLDSGILVKIFIDEPDSELWRRRLHAEPNLVSSTFAIPEMRSAIRQKVHAGTIHAKAALKIWSEFQNSLNKQAIRTFPIGPDVIDECVSVLDQLPRTMLLRTLDALHLATAKVYGPCPVATSDARMMAAATALKIPLL